MFKDNVTFQGSDAYSRLCDYMKTSEANEEACPVNDLDCFFLCQGYYIWSASRGEGPSGAFVTHCNISQKAEQVCST